MGGMYVSPERVERGGWLIAYAGEKMMMEEAARRGLVRNEAPEQPKGPQRRGKKAAGK